MSSNEAVAACFEEMARLLDLLGADSFRVSAHARAARAIADHPADIATLVADRAALTKIDGVGSKTADKIIECINTGTIAELKELRAQVPPGLLELLHIPGLGPKTVRMFWKDAGVIDKAGLKRIIDDGTILNLPRMGAKSVEKLKASLAFENEAGKRLNIGLAMPLAERLVERFKAMAGVIGVQFAGSLRRGKDTVGDLDILVAVADAPAAPTPGASKAKSTDDNVHPVLAAFVAMPDIKQVLAAGERKASARVALNFTSTRWKGDDDGDGSDKTPTIQVDVRLIAADAWGAALMYFTGSKDHNVVLRGLARDKGLTLNEYGLFPDPEAERDQAPPQSRGVKAIASRSEEEIFKALGVAWVPPEIREAHGETSLPQTPSLITLADVKAELHAHTTASDGRLSLRELVLEAKSRGFHTITVTDHSKSSAVANGLSVERLLAQIDEIHRLRGEIDGITILAGSEVDILADGVLDYDDDILARLDVVVASPHVALSQDPATSTKRLLKAIRHPMVHVIGHPTGRLVNRRAGMSPAMNELIAAAKEHRVALEINAHWMRLDLRDTHVRQATEADCMMAIDCDVHERDDFNNLRYGVLTARRGWLRKEQCVNTWPAADLQAWLKSKR